MRLILCASALLTCLTACQQDARPQGEAETHWLEQCDANADCGDGLCVCGVCTVECGADDLCDGEARPACANVQQLAQVCGEPIAACVRECTVDADCGAGDFECRDGVCVAAGLPEPEAPEPEGQPEPDAPEPEAPEPEGEPEPQPEPQPEPVEDCARVCARVDSCLGGVCEGAIDRDAIGADCSAACDAELVGLIDAQPQCADVIQAYRGVDDGFNDRCTPCAEICDDFAGCFDEICGRATPDALTAECRMTCDLLGPAEWGIGLRTCDTVELIMRDSWPNAGAACWPEPDLACAVPVLFAGDPVAQAGVITAAIQALAPALEDALAALGADTSPADAAAIRDALGAIATGAPICDADCDPIALDAALDAVERAARLLEALLDESAQASILFGCMGDVARGLGSAQWLSVAATCGAQHPTARLLGQQFSEDVADPLDMLCLTRNAYDLCQARYLGVDPLAEPDRCPTCTVGFGETMCDVPARDTCGVAGECLCAAIGLQGEACEFQAFGPRGAIAFGEACGQSDAIGPVLAAGGFDDGGLDPTASAGCDLMPAVLESRTCGGPGWAGCDHCYIAPPGATCEPGNPGCAVYIDCEQRIVATTEACEVQDGRVCPEGWAPTAVCLDDRPCEPMGCGTGASCQPERP